MNALEEQLRAALPGLEPCSRAAADLVLEKCPDCLTKLELRKASYVPTVEEFFKQAFSLRVKEWPKLQELGLELESPGQIKVDIQSGPGVGMRAHYCELRVKDDPAPTHEYYAEEIDSDLLSSLLEDLTTERRGLFVEERDERIVQVGIIDLAEMGIAPPPELIALPTKWRRPARLAQVQVYTWSGTNDRVVEITID